ncbi:MAG: enoyl-CoA hydratase/isomerase family protein [Acidobacteriia bacterium]|nr:enoyl-CoA hydratase/isomerase family protein [Terriglobia bacterium]
MATATRNWKYQRLMVSLQAPVARIILANPPVNVMDVPMMEELLVAMEQIEARADIAAVVFAGSDRAFSAGVDVSAHTPDKVGDMLVKMHAVMRALADTRKVTIAAVRGNCFGGGAELAAMCDLVFTTDTANWGFPEITLGCFPPVAAVVLSAIVGQKRAADLILTGRKISGEEAMRIGLANEAVPEDELSELVDETSERLGKLSAASLAMTKKALYSWDAIHFDKGLMRAEQIYLEELMKLEDAHEGIKAFMEKRKPVWKGK